MGRAAVISDTMVVTQAMAAVISDTMVGTPGTAQLAVITDQSQP